jgi:hypothetical protein
MIVSDDDSSNSDGNEDHLLPVSATSSRITRMWLSYIPNRFSLRLLLLIDYD